MNSSSQALRPAETGKTAVSRTIDIKVVRTPPAPSGELRTSQLALSTALVGNGSQRAEDSDYNRTVSMQRTMQ